MREEELTNLVRKIQRRQTELQTVELKSAEKGFPKIYDTLSAFSNRDEGGVIIFGISEKDNYRVVGVYDIEDAQKKAMEACNQMEPLVRAVFTTAEIDGKLVLSAEIPSVEYWSRPVFYKGAGRLKGSYIRVSDGDQPMTEYEVYCYEAFKRRIREDLRIVPECRYDLLNQERLSNYFKKVKKEKTNLASLPNETIMELMGLTVKGEFTLASALVFSIYPQAWFPQLCITAVSLPGTAMGITDQSGARFLDNKRITGAIPDMLEEAVEFVSRNMRTKTIIGQDGKRADKDEYPVVAVREGILNALIHRDYGMLAENTTISIEMYRDRMEIINKGGLYGGGSVKMLGKGRPETRNAVLASILETLKITENRYSGIPTIIRTMEEAELPPPEFQITHGEFRLILRNGTEISTNEIDKTDIISAVLQFCRTPRSREEITNFTGKSRYHTMSTIVQPLIEQGKLKMTIPEKPKSPSQKFVTT